MANQIDRDAFVTRDVLKNPISYVRGTDLIPIVIHFRDFQIPSGATARVFVAKSDGNAVYTTATIDGNDVTIDVQGQMFIELGTALMQISIMDGDEELCTFVQPVNVEPNLKAGDFPASGNDITFLDDAIEQANQAVNTATTAAQKASAAVQNANTAISNANKAISDLNAQIATLENNFASLAQTVEISQLQTVAKTLAGAVNELNSKIDPEVTESYRTIIDYFKTNIWDGLASGQTFFTTFTTNGPMHCALGYKLTSSNVDYGAVIIMTYSTVGTPHRPIFMRITSGTWYDPLYL